MRRALPCSRARHIAVSFTQITVIMSAPPRVSSSPASSHATAFQRLIDQIRSNAIQTVELTEQSLSFEELVMLCDALSVGHRRRRGVAMWTGEMRFTGCNSLTDFCLVVSATEQHVYH